jgi:hypothetical protein
MTFGLLLILLLVVLGIWYLLDRENSRLEGLRAICCASFLHPLPSYCFIFGRSGGIFFLAGSPMECQAMVMSAGKSCHVIAVGVGQVAGLWLHAAQGELPGRKS